AANFGSNLDGTLKVRQGGGGVFRAARICATAIRLQSLERRGGGLYQWNIKLLHRSQRFASSPRRLDAASPSASSTFSLDKAVTCSSASVSPLWQLTAFNPSTNSLPRLPIDPAI